MTDSPISRQVFKLKSELEARLNWGGSSGWSNYDFEQLSEQITGKTGVSLSTSTLKRILGKIGYKSEPSVTTLNALSQFLDYTDWRDFTSRNIANVVIETPATVKPIPPVAVKSYRKVWRAILLGFGIILTFSFFLLFRASAYNPDDFSFSSKTMLTEGLPNSVIFDFDASRARGKDSVFISQSWDTRRKVLVNKSDRHHSSIYYYPGYFRAKLIIGGQTVREHDIQIKTDGWLGLAEADQGAEPLYFKQAEIVSADSVTVSRKLLGKYNLPLAPAPPKIRFYNQKDIGGILTDNFTFETELKNGFFEGANACQRVEVLLQAKNDILIVPLAGKGCVGDISLAAFGHYAASNQADLSGFGCDPKQWTKLRIECKTGQIRFYVNNGLAYKTKILNRPAEIVGVQFRFNGIAAVRNTWLQGAAGKVVF